jgi:hypothetical protein
MANLGLSATHQSVRVVGDMKLAVTDVITTGVAGTDVYVVGGLPLSATTLGFDLALYSVLGGVATNPTQTAVIGCFYDKTNGKLKFFGNSDGSAAINESSPEFTGVALPGSVHWTARLWLIGKGSLVVR